MPEAPGTLQDDEAAGLHDRSHGTLYESPTRATHIDTLDTQFGIMTRHGSSDFYRCRAAGLARKRRRDGEGKREMNPSTRARAVYIVISSFMAIL